ncbi:MAG: flagellar hook-associated protein FlgK [Hyphomicrobium sp.]|nr:flagellar hook-associated protein FlgK [Hyphomicrobium sp.]
MTLGSAWSVGLSGLSTAADQIALVSRNVSRAGDADATRKIAAQTTNANGTVSIARIDRTAERALLEGVLSRRGEAGHETAIAAALDRLHDIVGDPELESSPAAIVATIEAELRVFAADPSNEAAGRAAVAAAGDLARTLNAASAEVSAVRDDADRAIVEKVESINRSLAELEAVSRDIRTAVGRDGDITDLLDHRDAILKSMSREIGIRTIVRDASDIVVYTDGGVTLFEAVAREVTVTPSAPLGPASTGAQILVDGVEVTGLNAVMPLRSGTLLGLVEIRDVIVPTFGRQLDEIARGLIETFRDEAKAGTGKPAIPGLFTSEAGTIPPSGSATPGLAALLTVHAAIDPAKGGDVRYLRDGGASAPGDPDYDTNPARSAGHSARLLELVAAISTARNFDPEAGLGATANLRDFAAASVGWLEERRQVTSDRTELTRAVSDRAEASLLSRAGINLDQEMADLLRFEQSFQASSRLIATVDQMIRTLIEATR